MLERLLEGWPRWARGPVQWLLDPEVAAWLAGGSAFLFVLSALGIPWLVARMPHDYFVRPRARLRAHPWHLLLVALKNVLGVILLLAGLAMLFLPGQGLITLGVGLVCLDLPGKRRLERRLVGWPPLLRALNGIRQRAGRPPLKTHP